MTDNRESARVLWQDLPTEIIQNEHKKEMQAERQEK